MPSHALRESVGSKSNLSSAKTSKSEVWDIEILPSEEIRSYTELNFPPSPATVPSPEAIFHATSEGINLFIAWTEYTMESRQKKEYVLKCALGGNAGIEKSVFFFTLHVKYMIK